MVIRVVDSVTGAIPFQVFSSLAVILPNFRVSMWFR